MNKRKNSAKIHIETIEKKYGKDIGVSFDQNLVTYLKEKGYPSLSKFLNPTKIEETLNRKLA